MDSQRSFESLTSEEEAVDDATRELRFDILLGTPYESYQLGCRTILASDLSAQLLRRCRGVSCRSSYWEAKQWFGAEGGPILPLDFCIAESHRPTLLIVGEPITASKNFFEQQL